MSIIPDENKIPRAIKNEWFYMIARVCMIVSLPVGSFLAHRIISKADEISLQVAEQSIELRILKTRIEYQLRADSDKLQDHELRLRSVEKR